MRTLYIALIFVGCLSLALGTDPVTPAPFPYNRPDPAACTQATGTAVGCAECQTDPLDDTKFNCKTAADGYYLDAGAAKACPRSCKTCSGAATCTVCNGEGFTTASCTACKAGFAFDNTNSPAMSGICIGVQKDSQYTCATDFFWDSTPNQNRKCVAKQSNCSTGYQSAAGDLASSNCDKCAQNYLNITSQAQFADNNWYWTYACVENKTITPRAAPVQCNGTEKVTGCAKCEGANNCSQAEVGYYLVSNTTGRLRNLADTTVIYTGLIGICPSQCSECTNENSCSKCGGIGYMNVLDVDTTQCKCDSDKGYTSSIPWTQVNKTKLVWYTCVSQTLGQTCNASYTFSSYFPTPTGSANCLNPQNDANCYTDTRTLTEAQKDLSLTSVWDRVPNPNRKCILATSKSCEPGYAVDKNWTKSQSDSALTGNCGECIVGLTLSGEQGNQVCQSTSSILVMSLAFLGLLLALVF